MTAISSMRTARLAGLLVGVALAATLVLASRPASGGQAVGADVGFYANQTGELAVSPAGPAKFIDDPALRPGESTSGDFRVTNQTGVREAIHLVALPSAHDLDTNLELRLSSAGATLAEGTLRSFARAQGEPLVLAPGQSATVTATASLSRAAGQAAAAAALVDVAITFDLGTAR
ncbi:MAG: hypothetical protein QOD14_2403 [Solirubrobacterales bacterium]|nr:hypothetical protein [Solirubrobacterales bacterium]